MVEKLSWNHLFGVEREMSNIVLDSPTLTKTEIVDRLRVLRDSVREEMRNKGYVGKF